MAIKHDRIREVQEVYTLFYSGFPLVRANKGLTIEAIAAFQNAAALMTLAYYTDRVGEGRYS